MALQTEIDFHPQNAPREEPHLDNYYHSIQRAHARSTPEKTMARTDQAIWDMWQGRRALPAGYEDLIWEQNFREFKRQAIARMFARGDEF